MNETQTQTDNGLDTTFLSVCVTFDHFYWLLALLLEKFLKEEKHFANETTILLSVRVD